jgi:hypothetical protein
MGRPATNSKKLRDGFYIEVRNKNTNMGINIRRDSKKQMFQAVKDYERNKEVILLGEIKNGRLIEINKEETLWLKTLQK